MHGFMFGEAIEMLRKRALKEQTLSLAQKVAVSFWFVVVTLQATVVIFFKEAQ
jgi:hypothetical protein